MDARELQHPHMLEEIMNAADYVDALLRPRSDRYVLTTQKIKGRRLRDQYLEEVTLVRLVEPQL